MKKYNILFVLVALMTMLFTACEDVDKVIYNPDLVISSTIALPTAPSGLSFIVDNADEEIDFSWSEAEIGVAVQVDYNLQISKDQSFETNVLLAQTSDTEASVKVSSINNALITLEYEIGQTSTVYCRVLAVINENVDAISSAVVNYDVTPYNAVIDYPMIFVPGGYQGWSPGEVNGRLFSYEFNDVYEGIINIASEDPATEFKIAPAPNWDNAWGGALTATADGYSGTLDASGGNLSVVPGVYRFIVDVSLLTIEMTKTDYWGVIGDAAGGWGDTDDVIMFYNGQIKAWETTTSLSPGGFKFRKNSSWGGDLTGDADGNLVGSGDNIAVTTAGTYDIVFDIANMTYSFTLVE